MMSKHLITGAVLCAAVLASPAVLSAERSNRLTGNVAVTSDYMFRGIDLSGSNAAVQGGVDYTMVDILGGDIYTGLWVSSASVAGGNEADGYVGYALKLGDFDLTAGGIYYLYSEGSQVGGGDFNYYEGFIGAGFGPVAVKAFYTPEYGFDSDTFNTATPDGKSEALYATASVKLDLSDSISLIPQVGFSSGDGIKDTFNDEYIDYSITAIKKLKDDWSVSLTLVDTDRENTTVTPDVRDDPKFVVGIKKGFKL